MRSEGSRLLGALDVTQRDIARRVGAGRATVARWASGQCVPSGSNREALRRAFGIPVDAWPNEWVLVRDIVVRTLHAKAPGLLEEIVDEIERMGGGPGG